MKQYDVAALGELLIDFTPAGVSEQGAALLARNPGGAPANVLAMLSRMGKSTAFIGKVGQDSFGHFLKKTLEDRQIDISGLVISDREPTTLAFVSLDEKGERAFDFYRSGSADVMLRAEEVPDEILINCRIFHFGSVSMTEEPARSATLYAARRAKELGKTVSYDPNFRPALWKDREEALRVMRDGLALADIVKVSEEESELLTGERDFAAGAQALVAKGAKLALVTAGEKGCWYATLRGGGYVPSIPVEAVDTTGAGDTFLGAVLDGVLERGCPVEDISEEELRQIIRFANVAGALCTTGLGAIPSMPGREQVLEYLKETTNYNKNNADNTYNN